MESERGLAWWEQPPAPPVHLLVDGGRVVDCPPHARPWALGRTGGDIHARAVRQGAAVTFTPLTRLPEVFQTHLTGAKTPLRRWRRAGVGHLADTHLTFGQAGARWWLSDTGEPWGWLFDGRDDAVVEVRRRMASGRWTRVTARYGTAGEPLEDPVLEWFEEPV